ARIHAIPRARGDDETDGDAHERAKQRGQRRLDEERQTDLRLLEAQRAQRADLAAALVDGAAREDARGREAHEQPDAEERLDDEDERLRGLDLRLVDGAEALEVEPLLLVDGGQPRRDV